MKKYILILVTVLSFNAIERVKAQTENVTLGRAVSQGEVSFNVSESGTIRYYITLDFNSLPVTEVTMQVGSKYGYITYWQNGFNSGSSSTNYSAYQTYTLQLLNGYGYVDLYGPMDVTFSWSVAGHDLPTEGGTVSLINRNTANDLYIQDYANKSMGSISSKTSYYEKAMVLLKQANGYQLGLTANKISSSTSLGISSSSNIYQTANRQYFRTGTTTAMTLYDGGKVGIGTTSPEGKLVINNTSSAGTPGLIVNNTYVTYDSKDIEDQRPFVLRRTTSDGESLSTYVHDTRARFVYKNDEYASGIEFRLINTDKENSDGSRSSDRTVMTISSGQNYGQVQVDGKLLAEEIKVELIAAKDVQMDGTLAANNITYTANGQTADHVFEENYNLRSLEEIEAFVKANKHLPEIPSASAMEEEGVNLAEMNKLLLQKVEELTLYLIQQQKEIEELKIDLKKIHLSH